MYLLRSKYQTLVKFILYKNEAKNQLNKKIKVLQSDWGDEYEWLFHDICTLHIIIHETKITYLRYSNRFVEWKNWWT